MIEINKWLGVLRSTESSIQAAQQASEGVAAWVSRNVVASDVLPRRFPPELDERLQVLDESLRHVVRIIGEIDTTITLAMCDALGGRPITREQFHLLSAMGCMNYTNKSAGLSEYDDYEIFQQFWYEDESKCGYIAPDQKPLPSPVTIGDTTTIHVRPGPSLAPEDIIWERLKPEQREFFERYIPDVAGRIKRET